MLTSIVQCPKKPRIKLINLAYGDINKVRGVIPRPILARPDPEHVPSEDRCKVVAWNVKGLRALFEKRSSLLFKLWKGEKVDVLGLMEIKTSGPLTIQTVAEQQLIGLLGDDVNFIWNPGKVKGYVGTLVLIRPALKKRLLSVDFGPD